MNDGIAHPEVVERSEKLQWAGSFSFRSFFDSPQNFFFGENNEGFGQPLEAGREAVPGQLYGAGALPTRIGIELERLPADR